MAEAARQSRCFTDAVDLCLLLADGVAKGNLYCDFSMKAARPMLKHKGDEEECLMFLHLKDLLTARGLPPTTFGYDLDKDGNIPNDDIVHIYFAKA
jgi:hypothetical protein